MKIFGMGNSKRITLSRIWGMTTKVDTFFMRTRMRSEMLKPEICVIQLARSIRCQFVMSKLTTHPHDVGLWTKFYAVYLDNSTH